MSVILHSAQDDNGVALPGPGRERVQRRDQPGVPLSLAAALAVLERDEAAEMCASTLRDTCYNSTFR